MEAEGAQTVLKSSQPLAKATSRGLSTAKIIVRSAIRAAGLVQGLTQRAANLARKASICTKTLAVEPVWNLENSFLTRKADAGTAPLTVPFVMASRFQTVRLALQVFILAILMGLVRNAIFRMAILLA